MTNFKAGFSRLDITPPLGEEVSGYFNMRYGSGILDPLQVNTIVVDDGENKAALISIDSLMNPQVLMDEFRNKISEDTGIPYEGIFIHCTHTHTGALIGDDTLADDKSASEFYTKFVGIKMSDSVKLAIDDCKPAKMGYAVGQAPRISFIRRFRMKDGGIRTNPGVNNPDILEALGEPDERVNVLRFVREGGHEIVLANFGVHPDTVGGDKYSADYIHFVRETTENALPNVKCLFFNGVEGDVNHINVHPTGGDNNGLFPMFDDADRGYEHTAHMGRVIAGGILQVYTKVKFTNPDCVKYVQETLEAPSSMPTEEELILAEKYNALHVAGKDDEIPFEGMELTTVVSEAHRMVQLKNGPETFSLHIAGIRIGDVAFVGIPGEPFTEVGINIKKKSPFEMTLPCALTNGAEGYYPTKAAYEEGGYEARSSYFKSGIAELITDKCLEVLESLKD